MARWVGWRELDLFLLVFPYSPSSAPSYFSPFAFSTPRDTPFSWLCPSSIAAAASTVTTTFLWGVDFKCKETRKRQRAEPRRSEAVTLSTRLQYQCEEKQFRQKKSRKKGERLFGVWRLRRYCGKSVAGVAVSQLGSEQRGETHSTTRPLLERRPKRKLRLVGFCATSHKCLCIWVRLYVWVRV